MLQTQEKGQTEWLVKNYWKCLILARGPEQAEKWLSLAYVWIFETGLSMLFSNVELIYRF